MALKLPPLQVCRGLLKEVSRACTQGSNSEQYKFIMEKYKTNQITSAKYCRALDEANRDAATYWCLLRSTREHTELLIKYHGTGEKTTEQAANLVGLKLPKDYVVDGDTK